eukprot:443836_1
MGSLLSTLFNNKGNGFVFVFLGYLLYKLQRFTRQKYRNSLISSSKYQPKIAIIGCGFGGICMAIKLKTELNYNNFIIYDKHHEVGGVWSINTYPGCECDVLGSIYSFSFEPKCDWSVPYPPQAETLQYIKDLVTKYKLRPHIQLNTAITKMKYNKNTAKWILNDIISADIVIPAVGILSEPNIPHFNGLKDKYKGTYFHSAQWNHSFNLSNKNVAVIGSGSSAIQLIPKIADKVKNLYHFSRSCTHIFPKPNDKISSFKQILYRYFKFITLLKRYSDVSYYELLVYPALKKKNITAQNYLASYWKKYRNYIIGENNTDLIHKTTPKCVPQAKRTLLSSYYYKTLANKKNVHLIQQKDITSFNRNGMVYMNNQSQKEYISDLDAVIFATGFKTQQFLCSISDGVYGINGQCLQNETWKLNGFDNAFAYLGVSVSGFPNLFMMYGPGTNPYISALYMIECEANYIVQIIEKMIGDNINQIDVKKDVMDEFNVAMDNEGKNTVWDVDVGENWYINYNGRIPTNWPWSMPYFWWLTSKVNFNDFNLKTISKQNKKLAISKL